MVFAILFPRLWNFYVFLSEILNGSRMEKTLNNSNVTIVTVCDNNYIMLLAALLKSIETNNVLKKEIDFYIVEDSISNRNRIKFMRSFASESINIHWLKMTEIIPKDSIIPADSSTYPLNIYIRLFIPHF